MRTFVGWFYIFNVWSCISIFSYSVTNKLLNCMMRRTSSVCKWKSSSSSTIASGFPWFAIVLKNKYFPFVTFGIFAIGYLIPIILTLYSINKTSHLPYAGGFYDWTVKIILSKRVEWYLELLGSVVRWNNWKISVRTMMNRGKWFNDKMEINPGHYSISQITESKSLSPLRVCMSNEH